MAAAPILDKNAIPKFTAIVENSVVPSGIAGTLVSALIDSGGSLNNFSDSDGDSPAIAITATNLAGGTLYFTTDGGSTWSDVGTVSDSSSRVLYADNNTRLAFIPAANYTGTISDLVTFKAWDRTGVESISSKPTLKGTFDTSGDALDVTLSTDGKTAFVADYDSGLQIIDVSNPSSPTLKGTFDTSGRAVDVTLSADGKTAFVADDDSGLQIIDVSNPASPKLIETLDTSGYAYGVALSADGKAAFVADDDSGLQIIDVSNPVNPTLTGTFDTSGSAYGVTLSADGKTAFVADDDSGLQIIDVSNPASPTLKGTFETLGRADVVTLSADGKTAFVASRSSGLQIFDVSNPASPTIKSTFDTSGKAFEIILSADGKTAFVADDDSGLQIIDVSNPSSPSLKGTFDTSGSAYGVTLSADGKTAFVADQYSNQGLQIINLTEPAQNGAHSVATSPTLTGTFDTSGDALDVTLSADGKTAFVADDDSGLQIIDVSNPASPKLKGTFDTSGRAVDVTLSADGKTAFVADDDSGLQIIDVSNPASPKLKGTFDTSGRAVDVTLSADGKTAFVADDDSGLQLIDVSNPASPTLKSTFDTSGYAYGVTLSADGKTAFVAGGLSGLQVIDVNNPASPTIKSTFDTSGSAFDVTLSADGKTAFVASSGLQIIDVSNHASPTLKGTFDTSGKAFEITLSADGKTAFVASSGLQIIDVSNHASPTLKGTFDTSGKAFEITLSADGKTAFVASSGLQIIDLGYQQHFSSNADTASIDVLAAPTSTPTAEPTQEPTPTPTKEVSNDQVQSIDDITTPEKVSTLELKEPIALGEQEVETLIVGTDKKDSITGSSDGEILAGGNGKDVLQGGNGADGFLFQDPESFGKKEADTVKDFDPEEGDSVLVDKDIFNLGKKVKLKVVTGKKASKDARNSKKDFIYDEKKGLLYFNENDKEDGWGDGGLFVKLKGAPKLLASNFTIFELKKPIAAGEQEVEILIIGTDKKDKITGSSDGEVPAGGDGKDVLQGADGLLFQDSVGFGKKEADKVKDFDPEEGDIILVDKNVFSLGKKVKLKVVAGKKSSKNASNSKEDFIYDDKRGFLYFNENGKKDGWGDGGLFVKLKGAPELGASDFTIV